MRGSREPALEAAAHKTDAARQLHPETETRVRLGTGECAGITKHTLTLTHNRYNACVCVHVHVRVRVHY